MLEGVLNHDHLADVLDEAFRRCRHRLLIATADVKNLHVPTSGRPGRGRARSILAVFEDLGRRNIDIRLLHSGVPSRAFLDELKTHLPPTLTMRRCPRVHLKAVIADGRWMYLGSANLTGAGLGAKSTRRRNFEAGIRTDRLDLIDPVADMIEEVWNGNECRHCCRTEYCPVPLEEPRL